MCERAEHANGPTFFRLVSDVSVGFLLRNERPTEKQTARKRYEIEQRRIECVLPRAHANCWVCLWLYVWGLCTTPFFVCRNIFNFRLRRRRLVRKLFYFISFLFVIDKWVRHWSHTTINRCFIHTHLLRNSLHSFVVLHIHAQRERREKRQRREKPHDLFA